MEGRIRFFFGSKKRRAEGKKGGWKADIDDLMTTVSFFPQKFSLSLQLHI